MNDQYNERSDRSTAGGDALHAVLGAAPLAIFAGSVLFDVIALFAESPAEAAADRKRAAALLKAGLGTCVGALGIELLDALNVSPAAAAGATNPRLILNGAAAAIYLVDLAERERQAGGLEPASAAEQTAVLGLSLAGLALLGVAQRLG